MAKLTELKDKAIPAKVVVYGPPKTGKTELVGNLAEHFNLVWFDLENGFETLLKMPLDWQQRVDVISIPDTRAYPIAVETILKVLKYRPVTVCNTHGKVDCPICKRTGGEVSTIDLGNIPDDTIVVFDSFTQLANSVMARHTKDKEDDYKYEWDDYRVQGTLMDMILSSIQQAPFKCVVITHETETKQEDGTVRIVPVAGTTVFSRNTAKYFGHVVYCQVRNKKHAFTSSTTASNNITTGSRTNADVSVSASLLSIFKPSAVPVVPAKQESKPSSGTSTGSETSAAASNSDKLAALKARTAATK